MQRNKQTKSTTTAINGCLDTIDVVEPIVVERRAFWEQTECDFFAQQKRKTQVRAHLGVVWRLQSNWNIPQCVEEVWIQLPCKKILSVGTKGCLTASKLQPSAMTERLRKCFTSTIVRTCDTVFPLFGGAGTKPTTGRGQMRLKDRVSLPVAQMSRSKKREGTSPLARTCKTTEVENNPILKSSQDEPRRRVPTQPEHFPRRWAAQGPAARRHGTESQREGQRVQWRGARNNRAAAAMTPDSEEPPTRRQRAAHG